MYILRAGETYSFQFEEKYTLFSLTHHPPSIHPFCSNTVLYIGKSGGAALIIDYGQDGPYEDSLVALRRHEAVKVREGVCISMKL
jgi:hypothetical protein